MPRGAVLEMAYYNLKITRHLSCLLKNKPLILKQQFALGAYDETPSILLLGVKMGGHTEGV